ncbi:Poly U specific endoribonuclease [Taenia solium]|eukprot:TsM_001197200 transcript=TsM_001197200 gene=TsM_001197200
MRIGRGRAFLWLAVFFGLALLVESRKNRGKDPDFERLVNKLWELDVNRLQINKDFVLNLQGFVTKPPEDKAPEPLFTFVNGTRLYNTPTFRAFIELKKFYDPNVLVVEITSPQKVQSQMAFLDAILATPVMVEVRRYLEEKKLASPIDEEFKEMLGHLWFTGIKRKKGNPVPNGAAAAISVTTDVCASFSGGGGGGVLTVGGHVSGWWKRMASRFNHVL